MKDLKGLSIKSVTLHEFLAAIDAELVLRNVKFATKNTATGEITTYYISRDPRSNEHPYPEKTQ